MTTIISTPKSTAPTPNVEISSAPPCNWRTYLAVHPAADLFPLMAETELKELVEDIRVNGLRAPLVGWAVGDVSLLDGRNRLDALARLGLLYETDDHHLGVKKWTGKQWSDRPGGRIGREVDFRSFSDGDPYAIALSLNVHRRHLTNEQKRELIAKLLKAQPEKSDRQIAGMAKADHKTVATVRSEEEGRGEIPHVEVRTDSKGREQPATKPKPKKPRAKKPKATAVTTAITEDIIKEESAEASAEQRKTVNAALDEDGETAVSTLVLGHMDDLQEFDGHVLRLLQMTGKAKPERFAKTGVPAADLQRLAAFLAAVAKALGILDEIADHVVADHVGIMVNGEVAA